MLHQVNAEKAIIRLLMENPECYLTVREMVGLEDFTKGNNKIPNTQVVFAGLLDQIEQGKTLDLILLAEYTKLPIEHLEKYLTVPAVVDHLDEYLTEVYNATQQRKIETLKLDAADIIDEGGLAALQTQINEIKLGTNHNVKSGHIGSIIDSYYDETTIEFQTPIDDRLLKTGLNSIDQNMKLYAGNFLLLAARPGMGKTALVTQMADAIAHKHPVAFVILETSTRRLLERWLSYRTKLPINDIIELKWREPENQAMYNKVMGALTELRQSKLMLYGSEYRDFNKFESLVYGLAQEKVRLIIVDFIQLMYYRTKAFSSRNYELGMVATEMADMTTKKILGNPTIIALSQLSRNCEARQDKRPMLSDLRDSGELDNVADYVGFIYRDAYYTGDDTMARTDDGKDIVELITEKNRNGAKGTSNLVWDGKNFTYYDMVSEQKEYDIFGGL